MQPFAPGPGSQYGLMLWGAADERWFAWSDVGGLYAQVLGADGTPVAPAARAALALNKEQKPAVAWNGAGFTAAWTDTRDWPIQVYGAALNQNAAPARATSVPDLAIRDHDGRPGSRLGRNEFVRGVEWEHDQHHARAPV